jgi:quercetin dioxygenase-like cupin family protein
MIATKQDSEKQSTMTGGSSARLAEQFSRPVLLTNLETEIAELWKLPALESAGRVAKTLAKHPDLRVILMVVRKGTRINEHGAAGRVSIHTLHGKVTLHVQSQVTDLPAGNLLVLDQDIPHDVVAEEDSAFLVTIAWPVKAK